MHLSLHSDKLKVECTHRRFVWRVNCDYVCVIAAAALMKLQMKSNPSSHMGCRLCKKGGKFEPIVLGYI